MPSHASRTRTLGQKRAMATRASSLAAHGFRTEARGEWSSFHHSGALRPNLYDGRRTYLATNNGKRHHAQSCPDEGNKGRQQPRRELS